MRSDAGISMATSRIDEFEKAIEAKVDKKVR